MMRGEPLMCVRLLETTHHTATHSITLQHNAIQDTKYLRTDTLQDCVCMYVCVCVCVCVCVSVDECPVDMPSATQCNTLQETTATHNLYEQALHLQSYRREQGAATKGIEALQHTATHCSTLQLTATHCDAPSAILQREPRRLRCEPPCLCVRVCVCECVCECIWLCV